MSISRYMIVTVARWLVVHHQLRIDLSYLLGDQAVLEQARAVVVLGLVAEGHGAELQEVLARCRHTVSFRCWRSANGKVGRASGCAVVRSEVVANPAELPDIRGDQRRRTATGRAEYAE